MDDDSILAPDAHRFTSSVRLLRNVAVLVSLLMGGFTLSFGLGWIPGLRNEEGAAGTLVISIAAAFLFAMAVFGWFLFDGLVRRAAVTVRMPQSGIVATLSTGKAVSIPWTDAMLDLTVKISTTYPTASAFLEARGTQGTLTARVTRDAATRIVDQARRRGLLVAGIPQGNRAGQEVTSIKRA